NILANRKPRSYTPLSLPEIGTRLGTYPTHPGLRDIVAGTIIHRSTWASPRPGLPARPFSTGPRPSGDNPSRRGAGEIIVTGAGDNQKGEAAGATSLGLLERARSHDAAAWGRLVQLYAPLVDRWCRQASLQDADAADVRQEVFLAVARGLDEFRRDSAGG